MTDEVAALRHEPIGCVVTIVAGEHGAVRVLDVAATDAVVSRCANGRAEHYADVHGAMVLIGTPPHPPGLADAALIIDLPEGRVRATGAAYVVPLSDGRTRVVITAGCCEMEFRILATCSGRVVAEVAPAGRVRS